MAFIPLKFRPGANRDNTRYANEGAWWDMDKVRFFSGYPQKIGGWQQLSANTYLGFCKFLHNWVTLVGENLLAVGTNLKMYIERGGVYHDITPIRATVTLTDPFTTTPGSNQVLVTHAGHGALSGDFVTLSGATTVGGVPAAEINTEHQVYVVTADQYFITVTTPAAAPATGGGAVTAVYQPNTKASVAATGGGYGVGGYGSGAYNMFTTSRFGQYVGDNFGEDLVFAIRDGGVFYWSAAGIPASLSVRGEYMPKLPGALAAPMVADNIMVTADQHVVCIGTDTISATHVGGNLFTTGAAGSTVVTVRFPAHGMSTGDYATVDGAVDIDGIPATELNAQHQVTALSVDLFTINVKTGCTVGGVTGGGTNVAVYAQNGVEDPMMIRWCAQGNPLNWLPKATNTAGDYRLTAGSYTYAVKRMRQENLVWTDTALYSMQFVGPPVVFAFTQLAENISIASATAVAVVDNTAFWMGTDKFYMYDGRVVPIPCDIRRYVYGDINRTQFGQVAAGTNTEFNEVIWLYCSANALHPDRYVTYNYVEKVWAFGTMARSCWLDSQLRGYPIAAGQDGKLYYHEIGTDDGSTNPPSAITSFIESADVDIADGESFMFVQRCIPDVAFDGSTAAVPGAVLTLKTRNSPGGDYLQSNARAVTRTATVPFDQFTEQVWVRLRGRQVAFRIDSSDVGVSWQLGIPRLDVREDGMR